MKIPAVCLFVSCFVASRGLKFLHVGAPRTGTQTIFKALEILGFHSFHSGYNISNKAVLCNYMFHGGPRAPVKDILDQHDAAMDEPFHLMYKEALQMNPKTKMILPLADPDEWHENYVKFFRRMKPTFDTLDTIDAVIHSLGASLLQHNVQRRQQNTRTTHDACSGCCLCENWGCDFKAPTPESKARCIDAFKQHIANVKAQVPADQLLMFNLTDGWKPLVDFIGVPQPTELFPHQDHYAEHESLLETDKDDSLVSLIKSKGGTR